MSDPDSVYKQLALTCRALENKHDQHELTKKALASATADVERLQARVQVLYEGLEDAVKFIRVLSRGCPAWNEGDDADLQLLEGKL